MEGQIQVSHTLDRDLKTQVETIAKGECRSRSNMIAVLLMEAIAVRRGRAEVAIEPPAPEVSPR